MRRSNLHLALLTLRQKLSAAPVNSTVTLLQNKHEGKGMLYKKNAIQHCNAAYNLKNTSAIGLMTQEGHRRSAG
jgi:hypothetical protein